MSEQAVEPTGSEAAQEPEAVELPAQGDAAFGALMDALAPEEKPAEAGEGGEAADAATAGDGQAAAAGEGGGASAPAADAAATGADGKPAVEDGKPAPTAGDAKPADGSGTDAGGAGDLPPEWTASASEFVPKLGELSTQLEDKVARGHHDEALAAVKTEHSKYFEQISKHPRLLIGQEVPKIGGAEGEMEILRDAADAEQWQEAVKSVLVEEVRDRASRAIEENSGFLDTIHQSIELFQNNLDLIPGTKDFDIELANRFTKIAKPYELRVEEKLQGYSIPVQPIINQLRTELTAERAAKPAKVEEKKPAPNAEQAKDPVTGKYIAKEDQPQAGLQSKAGASSETEDYSTLFGTIGLPNLRI